MTITSSKNLSKCDDKSPSTLPKNNYKRDKAKSKNKSRPSTHLARQQETSEKELWPITTKHPLQGTRSFLFERLSVSIHGAVQMKHTAKNKIRNKKNKAMVTTRTQPTSHSIRSDGDQCTKREEQKERKTESTHTQAHGRHPTTLTTGPSWSHANPRRTCHHSMRALFWSPTL